MKKAMLAHLSHLGGIWPDNLQRIRFLVAILVGLVSPFLLSTRILAQAVAMQDVFNYTTSNLNGHAPTSGSGTWSTTYITGTSGASNISTNGTQALMKVNNGVLGGGGQAISNYSFTPQPNMLYTIQASFVFTGPIGAGYDCWAGLGFSSSANISPWMLLRPQATATDTPGATGFKGGTSTGSGNISVADFANPITATVTWNTTTGQAQYFIDGVLQSSWTTTTSLPTGSFNAFFQGFQTGNAVNVKNVTLTAQSLLLTSMQDNFTYTTGNINGHAPTFTPAGLGTWSVSASNATISTDGTEAVVLTNGGTPGAGNAACSYSFLPSGNMFYTARATLKFRGPIGSGYNCWAGLGFSTGGSSNYAPWMLISPQGVSTDNPAVVGFNNNARVGSSTVPAADYAAPIQATVTWNTSTGLTNFYIDNLLVSSTWTAASYQPTGQASAFFQGFQTGNAFTVENFSLTAQSLPLPTVIFTPNDPAVGGTPTDFMSMFTSPSQWSTARSFSTVVQLGSNFIFSTSASNLSTIASFAASNNLKIGIDIGFLIPSGGSCGNGEGYESLAFDSLVANKLYTAMHAAGLSQLYLQMDEPLEMGVEPTGVGPSWSCNLSMATAASDVQQSIQQFTNVFGSGNVFVGDTEPEGFIPPTDISSWMSAYHTAVGSPLQYIDNDFDFRTALNPTINPNMTSLFPGAGVTFGMIFGGGGNFSSSSSTQWVLACEENVQIYNATVGVPNQPQHITIASWGPYPTNVLPETSNSTLSNFCDYYFVSPYAVEPPPVGFEFLNNNYSNFFTDSKSEINAAVTAGWRDLRVQVAIEPYASCAPNLVALNRYYNATSGYYAYTISPTEASTLVSQGFVFQKVAGYVFPDSTEGGVPLYKFYNSTTHNYYYTPTSTNNPGTGWASAGIECYMPCNYWSYLP